jgi:hypothetical protein
LAFLEVFFFLHTEETLFFFDALAVDARAADGAVEVAETSRVAANAGARGEAVDAGVLGVRGWCARETGFIARGEAGALELLADHAHGGLSGRRGNEWACVAGGWAVHGAQRGTGSRVEAGVAKGRSDVTKR